MPDQPVYATYRYYVDLNRDRDFSDANEEISAYVWSAEWGIGGEQAHQPIAPANECDLVLLNDDGRFSPEHGSALSGFKPGALIKITITYNSTTRQHFIGWIARDGIQPMPGQYGQRRTRVKAYGYFIRLLEQAVRVAIQEGKRADEIITAILDAVRVYPPGFVGWLAGLAGFSNAGLSTYAGEGATDYANLEQGINTFNYAGDNWGERTTVFQAFRDIAAAEGGYIWEGRDGKLNFVNRHYWHADLANALDATLTGLHTLHDGGMDYDYGGDLLNSMKVAFHPRLVDSVASVVALANGTIQVLAGASETITLQYGDGLSNRIGAKSVVTPAATTDWTANAAEDGSGADLTANISVAMATEASGVTLTFTNNGSSTAYIRNLQVRGIKITDYGEQSRRYQDDDSIRDYDLAHEDMTLTMLDDAAYAYNRAVWEVQNRKDPRGRVKWIRRLANKNDAAMRYALEREIGDRIDLSEVQTGLDGEYFIIGERHYVSQGGYLHHVKHFVQRAPGTSFWLTGLTGFGEAGQATYAGF